MPDILSNLDLKIYVTSILLLILNDHGLSTLEKIVNIPQLFLAVFSVFLILQQLKQASADVNKVLESFEKTGKVPNSVMEARSVNSEHFSIKSKHVCFHLNCRLFRPSYFQASPL